MGIAPVCIENIFIETTMYWGINRYVLSVYFSIRYIHPANFNSERTIWQENRFLA
jgi:hypothetical protein